MTKEELDNKNNNLMNDLILIYLECRVAIKAYYLPEAIEQKNKKRINKRGG